MGTEILRWSVYHLKHMYISGANSLVTEVQGHLAEARTQAQEPVNEDQSNDSFSSEIQSQPSVAVVAHHYIAEVVPSATHRLMSYS
jgi:hypothetical protein